MVMLSEARKQAGRVGGGGEVRGQEGLGVGMRARNGVPRTAGRVGAEMESSWDGILRGGGVSGPRGGRRGSRARERRWGAGCAPQLSGQSL